MTRTDALAALRPHRQRLEGVPMRALFEQDAGRFEAFSARLGDLVFDYSKTRLDAPAREGLFALAHAADVEGRREAMFAGEAINVTEGRAVLHTALRNPGRSGVHVGGEDVMGEVHAVLDRMEAFADAVRSGAYRVTGGAVTDVVNIGIGGSDLGPAMAARALSPFHDGPRLHYVSNVDGADLSDTLAGLDPATTLFIVASKTFTTAETMANARSARDWVKRAVAAPGAHFAALSTNLEATAAFDIPPERTFGFWDWVGGRYSLWSAIGLSLMIGIGPARFRAMLAGAHAVDEHFRSAPLEENIPVLMALVGIWHRNVWDHRSHAVLPYDNRLARFPAYLQQLDMESNGKHVTLSGEAVGWETGPVVWGEPGTNGQHAFYQLIHQGTDVIPCDFLLAARPQEQLGAHHLMLAANCLAQSEALMVGRSLAEVKAEMAAKGVEPARIEAVAPHRVFTGDRPSCTILYRELDPATLGALVALYEHKVFVQGVIWDINSFDQWGVELGKVLAVEMQPFLEGKAEPTAKDGSTQGLVAAFRAFRGEA